MKTQDLAQWLQTGIDSTGINQSVLARAIGLTPSKINLILHGKRKMQMAEAVRASQVMDFPLPNENRTISVMGYVGAGAAVIPISDGDALHEVDMGFPIPPDMIGVIVRGDSMYPIFEDGDLVAYRGECLTPDQAIGETCVVQLADGRILIKKVRRGSQPGLYTLSSANAPDIEDVALEWAREFVMRFSRKYWRKS